MSFAFSSNTFGHTDTLYWFLRKTRTSHSFQVSELYHCQTALFSSEYKTTDRFVVFVLSQLLQIFSVCFFSHELVIVLAVGILLLMFPFLECSSAEAGFRAVRREWAGLTCNV